MRSRGLLKTHKKKQLKISYFFQIFMDFGCHLGAQRCTREPCFRSLFFQNVQFCAHRMASFQRQKNTQKQKRSSKYSVLCAQNAIFWVSRGDPESQIRSLFRLGPSRGARGRQNELRVAKMSPKGAKTVPRAPKMHPKVSNCSKICYLKFKKMRVFRLVFQ
jgi:hypothetical protein